MSTISFEGKHSTAKAKLCALLVVDQEGFKTTLISG